MNSTRLYLIFGYLFFFSFLFSGSIKLYSQIESPVFEVVTVDTSDHKPVLVWSVLSPADLDGYTIKRWLYDVPGFETNFHTIDTIENTIIMSYKDDENYIEEALPEQRSEIYFITAFKYTISDTLLSFSTVHQTMFLELQYNYCEASVSLIWNQYSGWQENFQKYQIWAKKNEEAYQLIGENDIVSDTVFIHENIEINSHYTYYIKALSDDNLESISNIADIETQTINLPDFLRSDSIIVQSKNQIDLFYEIDTDADIVSYDLFRFNSESLEYDSVASYLKNDVNIISFTDFDTNSREIQYYYLAAKDICNKYVFQSDTMNSIIIEASADHDIPRTNNIEWEDDTEDAQYTIYRQFEEQETVLNQTYENEYTDNIDDIYALQFSSNSTSGEFCYFIETESNDYLSRSETICVYQKEAVFLPNAFNPLSSDSENRQFKLKAAFVTNYQLIIYGTYGNVIFESKNPNEGWDGRLKDGSLAPRASYLYYLTYENAEGKIIKKKSSVALLY
jgi:gliding motility-associated-like protein